MLHSKWLLLLIVATVEILYITDSYLEPSTLKCYTVKGLAIIGMGLLIFSLGKINILRLGWGIASIGAILNLVVMVANDGFMPAVGLKVAHGEWIPITDAKLPILGDWLNTGIGMASIGDFVAVIGFGLMLGSLLKLLRKGVLTKP